MIVLAHLWCELAKSCSS